jgi:SAM-dependent MidA family methyltransferase
VSPPIPPVRIDQAATRLPEPGEEALAHSHALVEVLRQELEGRGGRLPFDRYMELALYAPGLGYYTAGARKFGAAGDFVTAPEVSPLFGRCLARQAQQVLQALGGGDLLEFGAGTGRLAADLLAELERLESLPERYRIVDLSPDLRERQRATLAAELPHLLDRVVWMDGFPESGFRGVVVANELLDAMPVHRFRIAGAEIREQFVEWGDGHLVGVWDSVQSPGLESAVAGLGLASAEPYESEINLRAVPWVQQLSEVLAAGAVLLIDYGYPRSEYYHPQRTAGTLMCHYRHRSHADPLLYPGLQDITAHVDFTALAEAGPAAGLAVGGFTTQAHFLLACGLDRMVADSDPNDVRAHLALVQGVKRLTLPSEMGERFKVLALSRGIATPLLGFGGRDLRDRL